MKCKVKKIDPVAAGATARDKRRRELQAEIARLEAEIAAEEARLQQIIATPEMQALLHAERARRQRQYEQLPLVPYTSE